MKYNNWMRWFAPGINIKRWLFLFSLGTIWLVVGVLMMMNYQWISNFEDIFLEFLFHLTGSYNYTVIASLGLAGIVAGMVAMLWGIRKLIQTIVNAILPNTEDGVSDYIFEKIRLGQGPKIVVIGGGTGLSMLLRGLKSKTTNLTAIVTVADDGGSSGRLREDFQMIAPGDLRNCLVALAEKEGLMEELFQYRFTKGAELSGHSFGNLFLTAMTQVLKDDVEKALEASSKILRVRGRVIPSSTEEIKLIAKLTDGTIVEGESNIPNAGKPIAKVYTEPQRPSPVGAALQAIDEADAIILGPGSLYTSVMPNLLIDKVADHIANSKAAKIYICNVMTQPGETDGYTVSDHVKAIEAHSEVGIIDTVLVNDNRIQDATLEHYKQAGQEPVDVDMDVLQSMGVRTIRANLVDSQDKAIHNSDRLAKVVMDVVYALQTDIEPHILEYYLQREDH